jgi:3-dehydroquinate synthase
LALNKETQMKKIIVNLKERSYPIVVGRHILPQLGKRVALLNIGTDAVIITNKVVKRLYGLQVARAFSQRKISVKFFEVPDGEKSKSEKIAFDLIKKIASYDVKRKIFIVSLGGGVIGDLAGFVAAIYKRGIPLVHVPTTFLSQIDSAIGGKTAIDLPMAKNLVGAFYQPKLVISDVAMLKSLSLRQIRNGLAEAIKYGMIQERALFYYIEKHCQHLVSRDLKSLEHVVYACSMIKARIVAKDERETLGLRTILNFGHTVGHAIEAASVYGAYQHGEAVALGMRIAMAISWKLGLCSQVEQKKLEVLLTKAGLPQKIKNVKISTILACMAHDKKNISRKNRFVLIKHIGSAKIVQGISADLIRKTLKEYSC